MREIFAGYHPKIAKLRFYVADLLSWGYPILLIGERGVGKGTLATMAYKIYVESPSKATLYRVPMAGIPDELAESTLFGHVEGAYTGAIKDRSGVLRTAAEQPNSLVLLDDLPETSPAVQAKLLTALEEGSVTPLGADDEMYDIGKRGDQKFQLISTAQPGTMHQCRDDLRDRVSTFSFYLPPLRDVGGDCLMLAERKLELLVMELGRRGAKRDSHASAPRIDLGLTARKLLLDYNWPGNVRQLDNVMLQAAARCWREKAIKPAVLEEIIKQEKQVRGPGLEERHETSDVVSDWPTLDELDRRYVGLVLKRYGGNKSATARALKCSTRKLTRLLEKKD